MGLVAVIQDGKWVPVSDGLPPTNPRADTHVINMPMSDVDRIIVHLAEVIRLAQGLSPTDARRVRDLMHAAQAALTASTFLPEADQARFERALKNRFEG